MGVLTGAALLIPTALVAAPAQAAELSAHDPAVHAQVCNNVEVIPSVDQMVLTAQENRAVAVEGWSGTLHLVSYDIAGTNRVCDLTYLTSPTTEPGQRFVIDAGVSLQGTAQLLDDPDANPADELPLASAGTGVSGIGWEPGVAQKEYTWNGTVTLPLGMYLISSDNWRGRRSGVLTAEDGVPAQYWDRPYVTRTTAEWNVTLDRQVPQSTAVPASASVIASAEATRTRALTAAAGVQDAAATNAASAHAAALAAADATRTETVKQAKSVRTKKLLAAKRLKTKSARLKAVKKAKAVYKKKVAAAGKQYAVASSAAVTVRDAALAQAQAAHRVAYDTAQVAYATKVAPTQRTEWTSSGSATLTGTWTRAN